MGWTGAMKPASETAVVVKESVMKIPLGREF
jgi:hypothetical protein